MSFLTGVNSFVILTGKKFGHYLPETVPHLFWLCPFTKSFWKDFSRFITDHFYKDYKLFYEHIIFGFFANNTTEYEYLINLLIIMAKFSSKTPIFSVFYKELEFYIKSIEPCTNKKAVKTVSVWIHCMNKT